MPADSTAGKVAPETHATETPPQQQNETVNATTEATASDSSSLMDRLGIPSEVQEQIRPKATEAKAEEANPESVRGRPSAGVQPSTSEPEGQSDAAPVTAERGEIEHDDEVDDATAETEGKANPFKDPRVQKRLAKESRRKERLETRAETAEREAEELRTQLAKLNGQQNEAATAAPVTAGLLGKVTTEPQLNQLVAEADSLLDLIESHPEWLTEGAVFGEGEQSTVRKPEEFRAWKRDSEKITRNAEARRREIRETTETRQKFAAATMQDAPEFFDESGKWKQDSELYQTAVSVASRFPELRGRPDADYFLAATVLGLKIMEDRRASKQTSNPESVRGRPSAGAQRKGDIDPRAFAPRAPLAPHGATSTARESNSSQKKVTQAMQELVADPDGGASSLARVLAARNG